MRDNYEATSDGAASIFHEKATPIKKRMSSPNDKGSLSVKTYGSTSAYTIELSLSSGAM